jgi:thioesterase domain-containing protein
VSVLPRTGPRLSLSDREDLAHRSSASPIDGDVFWYFALANHLGPDQPFYALRARGLDGLKAPHTSLESAASDYIREIRQIQPVGPYYLGGYSQGASIAFEIAQQLQACGEEVGLLASFDSAQIKTDYYSVTWLSFGLRWVRAFPCRVVRFLRKPTADKVVVIRNHWHMLCRKWTVIARTSRHSKTSLHDRALRYARSMAEHLFGGPKLVPAHYERVIAGLYRASVDYVPFSGLRISLWPAPTIL